MKAKAVIFTCMKHLGAANIAAEAASRHFDVTLALDKSEYCSCVSGKVIWTEFQRKGNLNGYDASIGVAKTLLAHSDSGYVVKIDSDTIVKDAEPLFGYDISGFPQVHYPPSLLGCCYSISTRALEHSIKCIEKSVELGIKSYPEDVVITGYAQTLNKDDFTSNIMSIKRLGVWHPIQAPLIRSKIANFGIHRIAGNWCHDESLAAMRTYLNS